MIFQLFPNVIFSQTSSVFEAHSLQRSALKEIKIPMAPTPKVFNTEIIINIFDNKFSEVETEL